jgi:hypothetical protein
MPSPVAPDCPDSPQPSLDLGAPDPGVVIQLSTLAGFRHHQAPMLWPALRLGAPLNLVREADNAADPDAVAVYWRGRKLGYLPRGENLMAAALLNRRRALSARIRRLAPRAQRNQRLSLEVRMHSGT